MNGNSNKFGPYRILQTLGRGGMGVVYKAEHVQTHQLVALKTVLLPSQNLLQRLRREIRVLANINHPGIVQIVDDGVSEGVPWYSMELLRGVTLREWSQNFDIEDPPTQPKIIETMRSNDDQIASSNQTIIQANDSIILSPSHYQTQSLGDFRRLEMLFENGNLDDNSIVNKTSDGLDTQINNDSDVIRVHDKLKTLIDIIIQLCKTLSYLHGEGIVHRDLKPENIFIKENGCPVIVDFGLLSLFGGEINREALQIEAGIVGTARYMAPEQIRGELVDARADLYSLGCILYELLCGKPPFSDKSVVQLLQSHLHTTHKPLSESISCIPRHLENLVDRLLIKDPRERIGYADDIIRFLGPLTRISDDLTVLPASRLYLYRPGFSGRDKEMSILETAINNLSSGQGGLILVGGESGAGKTRLVMELARIAAKRRIMILSGECVEQDSRPLEAFRKPLQIIADRCRELGREESDYLIGRRGRLLALYEPLLDSLPGYADYPEPEELNTNAARLRLFRYLAETFAALSGRNPLLIVIDDLQWIDELSRSFIDHVSRTLYFENNPIILICTYRTDEGEGFHLFNRTFDSPGTVRLSLQRLTESNIGEMVQDMLAIQQRPERFVNYLSLQSEGNPFYVAEFLRTALDEGLLYRDNHGYWHVLERDQSTSAIIDYSKLPLPSSIKGLINQRLKQLSGPTRSVLEAAAVMGREFNEMLLTTILDLPDREIAKSVQELLGRQLIERIDAERIHFVHHKIREVTYENIKEEQQKYLHRKVALTLEQYFSSDQDDIFVELAKHWFHADELELAKPYYLKAAKRASDRYAHQEAEQLYSTYLEIETEGTAEHLEALISLATGVLRPLGRLEESISLLRKALPMSRERKDSDLEAYILERLANLLIDHGELEKATHHFNSALLIYKKIGNQKGETNVLNNLGTINRMAGKPKDAEELFHQALALARSHNNKLQEGNVLGNLSTLYVDQGSFDIARHMLEQSLTIFQQTNQRNAQGNALCNLAIIFGMQGDLKDAHQLLERSLEAFTETGDRLKQGKILGNLGYVHYQLGQYDDAVQLHNQALTIHQEVDNKPDIQRTLAALAQLKLDLGDPQEARDLYQQSLDLARGMGYRLREATIQGYLAYLSRLIDGNLSEAQQLTEKAIAIFTELNNVYYRAVFLCELGHIRIASGEGASDLLDNITSLTESLTFKPESELGLKLNYLRRANETFLTGQGRWLFRGQLIHDIPQKFRQWLVEQGLLDRIFLNHTQ